MKKKKKWRFANLISSCTYYQLRTTSRIQDKRTSLFFLFFIFYLFLFLLLFIGARLCFWILPKNSEIGLDLMFKRHIF